MRIILTSLIILLASCASLTPISGDDENQLIEAALKYAIEERSRCFDCDIKNIFISVNGVDLDASFISKFSYDGIVVLPLSESSTSCETGIVLKGTESRGYAFTVLEIDHLSSDSAKVKWGYWYSCKKYTYRHTTFVKGSNG
jgi:hypothetical protein